MIHLACSLLTVLYDPLVFLGPLTTQEFKLLVVHNHEYV